MGWAERWVRRLFALALALTAATSLSWIAAPVAGQLLLSATGRMPTTGPLGTALPGPASPGTSGQAESAGEAISAPVATHDQGDLVLPAPTGYVWPIEGAKLTTYFAPTATGTMMLGGLAVHDGVDLARPCGWPIAAAHAGTVIYAGRRADPYMGFSGPMQPYYDELARRKLNDSALPIIVVIDDGNGLIGVYAHLGKAIAKRGQTVRAGQTIGYEGATGNATGCHLHYELFLSDGPWVRVAWTLVSKWQYPLWMRLRVDPLLYLPADSPEVALPRWGLTPPVDAPRYVAPLADLPTRAAY